MSPVTISNADQLPLAKKLRRLHGIISNLVDVSRTLGLYLGVLYRGSTIHTAHFGKRGNSEGEVSLPNDDTVYSIASLTKAFTVSKISMLVDRPLSLGRTTFARFEGDNVALPHSVYNDSSSAVVPSSRWSTIGGLGGGKAGKSTISDLLIFYKAMPLAYNSEI
ncbi:hypothetical protein G7Y89_g6262 [Cudoniella acicularis]|uniref:Beta-lactamase-related domain-containing protein n=1 Tax=Cudoniella acicularis TaxID=354080 RepID=A0A8H4RKV4_9HELO|nr:hypothetical protein G7Y89_g6262 [Cudoniella acicularis]